MIRFLLICVFIACGAMGFSQPFKNEWIDYNKTYYKFPVAAEGLYRIPQSVLSTVNLGAVNAQDFQLWRDGAEQPLYTSVNSGPLDADGYIEFYGRPLDGSQDADLFPNPEFHVYKDLSFFSDTAWYFLTINTSSPNLRFTNEANTVESSKLLPDSFFMHTISTNFFRGGFSYNYNYGFANVPWGMQGPSNLAIRSSIWDQGEGFASTPFNANSPMNIPYNGMQAFLNGPGMSLFYSVVGGWTSNRTIKLDMNDSTIVSVSVPNFELRKGQVNNIPLSRIINDATLIKFKSDNAVWPEYSQANALYLTYPRKFHFNNQRVFSFNLPANANGNHLRIGKFLPGSKPAILLDLTNLKRYTAVSKGTDSSLLAIQPSSNGRKMVLANQADFLRQITAAVIRVTQFTDYSKPENQGDYLVITSNRLRDFNGTDIIEAYSQYRKSLKGGGFNVKVVDIEQLYDQYALGVRKNPLSIRRFIQYASKNFAVKPKFVLLIGRGVDYLNDRYAGNYSNREYQNSVPTWGSPGSDNLLGAENGLNPTPLIPLGRISAVNGKEINDYLEKVKQYESLDAEVPFSPNSKEWKKQAVQLIGGDDPYFALILGNFMNIYKKLISDTLVGANVKTYVKANNVNYANDVKDMTDRINNGVGLINYFGHSSTSSIDFNLASPDDFTNTNGKYPVFIANGCSAGNVFFINNNRPSYFGLSISERFVLAPNKGAIAFISNSNYGLYNYLHLFTQEWFKNATRTNYSKGIGALQQVATQNAMAITGPTEYFNRVNCEQSVLHGDPAIGYFTNRRPDYTVIDSLVKVSPVNASIAEDSLQVNVTFLNLGQAINDSVWVDIRREFPDGKELSIGKYLLRKLYTKDSLSVKIPVKGMFDKGTNYIVATIDPAGEREEMSETNNTARVAFEVSDEEIRPVFPYNYSILNKTGFHLIGSTVNAVEGKRTYRLQVDTTEFFNSPLLYQADTSIIGGAVDFNPNISWVNQRVYYWRLAPVFSGSPVNWRSSSFQYLAGPTEGQGQSHFYQHTKSAFKKTLMDSATRALKFANNIQNLYITNSIYGLSGDEDNHFSISTNGLTNIYSACVGHSIIFNIFDTLTLEPWTNFRQRYGSGPACAWGREYNFEFSYYPASNRKKIMDFLDSIPKGMIVTARLILDPPYDSSLVKYWQKDTAIFGAGKSLYHSLYNQGFYKLDSMYKLRTFSAVFIKDDSSKMKPMSRVSDGLFDRLNASYFVPTTDTTGEVLSPIFGPSAKWHEMNWKGHQPAVNFPSYAQIQLIGIDKNNKETLLRTYLPNQWNNDISDISASSYPYLRLKMVTKNSKQATPYQLDYWRVFFNPVADGALSALDHYVFSDPVMVAEKDSLKIELAFKNISKSALDSSSVRITIANRDGNQTLYTLPSNKILNPADTAIIAFNLDTRGMEGRYYAYIQVNRENNPVEQTTFNNFTYIPFMVAKAITFLEFAAKQEQQMAVRLDWKVTNELAVATYTVEHSVSETGNFTAIGTLPSKNSGTGNDEYTLLHQSPVEGPNYYRVKVVYQSGTIEYSPVRMVTFTRYTKLSVFPNPFHQQIFVTAPYNKKWLLEMFTVQGQRLLVKNGIGSTQVNTTNLPAGTYLVKMTTDEETNTLKFEKHHR